MQTQHIRHKLYSAKHYISMYLDEYRISEKR